MAKGTLGVRIKRRAAGGAAVGRKEELRCIGDSESFEPHFHVVPLRKADGLGERGIQVEEIGTTAKVPAKIAEGASGRSGKARSIEPGWVGIGTDAVSNLQRSNQIWCLRVARRVESRSAGGEVQRQS